MGKVYSHTVEVGKVAFSYSRGGKSCILLQQRRAKLHSPTAEVGKVAFSYSRGGQSCILVQQRWEKLNFRTAEVSKADCFSRYIRLIMSISYESFVLNEIRPFWKIFELVRLAICAVSKIVLFFY